MQVLIYAFMTALFFSHYLTEMELAPRFISWTPEAFAILFLLVFIFRGVTYREFALNTVIFLLLILLLLEITLGAILNSLPSGILFAGIRDNIKFIPLLLLPSVYHFPEKQLKNYVLFLLGVTLLQLPVTIFQRFFQYSGGLTGDVIIGTLKGSGILSVYLMASASMLTAFYIKGLLNIFWYIVILIMIFIPTTLNETKVTIFLLPIALIVPVIFNSSNKKRFKNIVSVTLVIGGLISVFIPIYDHFMSARRTEGLMDFFSTSGRLEGYLESTGRIAKPNDIRIDDPTKSFLGLGIGNVSDSSLGSSFTGKYFYQFESTNKTALSHWRFEIGLIGTALIILIFIKVLFDANSLSNGSGFISAFALGWIGVLAVLGISLMYNKAVRSNEVAFLLWFFSGYIVATRFRIISRT